MKLVDPDNTYQQAFHQFYADFATHDPDNAGFYKPGKDNFAAYVQSLSDQSLGINLPEGRVPCHHYWLFDQTNILGVVRIRHHIDTPFLSLEAGHIGYDIAPAHRKLGHGKQILQLGLDKAKSIGLSRALVCADEENIASRKIIESNGGKLDKIIMGEVYQFKIARYWIEIS